MGNCMCHQLEELAGYNSISIKPVDFNLPASSDDNEDRMTPSLPNSPQCFAADNMDRENCFPLLPKQPTERYQMINVIGKGTYGTVYSAIHRETQEEYAIKVISKRRGNGMNEAHILATLDHPRIISLHEILEKENEVSLVTELCAGGNLLEWLMSRPVITEDMVKGCMWQLVSALSYCHSKRIVHRDIKPENIVFVQPGSRSLKLIDFGAAVQIEQNQRIHQFVGTVTVNLGILYST